MNSVSAIIIWKNKILLFHRDNIVSIPNPDHWSLPGGIIEKGETPIQGIRRELSEEVTYIPKKIKFLKKLGIKNNESYVYSSFVNNHEAKRFKHGIGEGQEIKFFSLSEIEKMKLVPRLKKYLNRYKSILKIILCVNNSLQILVEKVYGAGHGCPKSGTC